MYCTQCGQFNRDTAKFCTACGSALRSSQQVDDTQNPDQTTNGINRGAWLFLVVVLIFLGWVLHERGYLDISKLSKIKLREGPLEYEVVKWRQGFIDGKHVKGYDVRILEEGREKRPFSDRQVEGLFLKILGMQELCFDLLFVRISPSYTPGYSSESVFSITRELAHDSGLLSIGRSDTVREISRRTYMCGIGAFQRPVEHIIYRGLGENEPFDYDRLYRAMEMP